MEFFGHAPDLVGHLDCGIGLDFLCPTSSSYEEIEGDDPLMLLKIRFAKGEISKEEYERI
ncbi:SHOCT domain-containing protein [Muricauda sp. MAR_2010_75]|uniref:SHOCT domain-containing protein n=1 Tax=Allomuricauda sp. MAR_2010_75 TaxID=1250232 RepID=UPI000AA11CE0|nr:SHOCT domain-containing protein [Muricauda sp. MAR_2010_75]